MKENTNPHQSDYEKQIPAEGELFDPFYEASPKDLRNYDVQIAADITAHVEWSKSSSDSSTLNTKDIIQAAIEIFERRKRLGDALSGDNS